MSTLPLKNRFQDEFKRQTLDADSVIQRAKNLEGVSEEFDRGFHTAMREAREAMYRVIDAFPEAFEEE